MEQAEAREETTVQASDATIARLAESPRLAAAVPALLSAPCPTCGRGNAGIGRPAGPHPPPWVYAIGRIEPRFPRLSVEKEFAQATGRAGTAGLTDRQALQKVLQEPQNRYVVRHLCWGMTTEGLETYIVDALDPT